MKYQFLILVLGIALISCSTSNQSNKKEVTISKLSNEPKKIQFISLDSVLVTANLYDRGNEFPVIILCHQARFNKVEYTEIAKTLFNKGFNCLAIDQRSGGHVVESFNETLLEANKKGASVGFLDAEQDITAAINYAVKKYNKNVILWGSSYSSTLSLHIACENKNVEAVVAFSPGSYFDEQRGALKDKLINLEIPMFVTSSKKEAIELSSLLDSTSLRENQIQYVPVSEGNHGSKALWKTDKNNEEYWKAISQFLKKIDIASKK